MSSFLDQYRRQPKIYIDLPSNGDFYDSSVVTDEQYTQLPVYGLNTMDELILKTPDALFSGEATVKVIQSCIPSITNPWKLVNIDIDFLLIAIRVATYGEDLGFDAVCPHCKEELSLSINLVAMLDSIRSKSKTVLQSTFNNLIIDYKPITYDRITFYSKEMLALQKEILYIEKEKISEKDKDVKRQKIIDLITNLTIDFNLEFIAGVGNSVEQENNIDIIKSFIKDSDIGLYDSISKKVIEINASKSNDDINVICDKDDCKKPFKTKIQLDYSTFFVKR